MFFRTGQKLSSFGNRIFGPPCTVFYAVAKRIELEQWDWSHFEALSKGFHYLFLFFY